jgi:hypothetical protein
MKAPTLAIVGLLTIAGCTVPYHEQQAMARNTGIDDLCLISATNPEFRQAANEEIARRRVPCDWQKVQLMMQAQQARQSAPPPQQILLQAPRYPAPVIDPGVTCTHMPMGNGIVRSDCR